MQLLEDGIIAALAAIGLVTLLLLSISVFIPPRRRDTLDAVVLVPCHAGEGTKLEQTVRALMRSRHEHGRFLHIVILDRGMDAEAKQIAALLCRDGCGVSLCERMEQIENITWEESS